MEQRRLATILDAGDVVYAAEQELVDKVYSLVGPDGERVIVPPAQRASFASYPRLWGVPLATSLAMQSHHDVILSHIEQCKGSANYLRMCDTLVDVALNGSPEDCEQLAGTARQ